MPTHTFQCKSCGFRFKKRTSGGTRIYCDRCGSAKTTKMLPSQIRTSFSAGDGSPTPQNTGISHIDYNADRAIGAGAVKKWEEVSDRNARKHEILGENPDATGADLSRFSIRSENGIEKGADYRVMKREERNARDHGMAIHAKALEAGAVPAADLNEDSSGS